MKRFASREDSVITRDDLREAKRIVVKAGTSVVSNEDGYVSLVRLSSIVEQVSQLQAMGKEVIIVSSGAVGVGRNLLRKQKLLQGSVASLVRRPSEKQMEGAQQYNASCAAAGQLGLMVLYENLFSQLDVTSSQLLLTAGDLVTKEHKDNVKNCLDTLLGHGFVPIVNENDAVSANRGYTIDDAFSDNDSLAALVAKEADADLLVLLTDVDGVYDRPPSDAKAVLISHYYPLKQKIKIGAKSLHGRGGMEAKVEAAMKAVTSGVPAVVVASGHKKDAIMRVVEGAEEGTLFTKNPPTPTPTPDPADANAGAGQGTGTGRARTNSVSELSLTDMAIAAREGGRALVALSSAERAAVLRALSCAFRQEEHIAAILEANRADVEQAKASKPPLALPMLKRLSLTREKLATIAEGMDTLAGAGAEKAEGSGDPLGRVLEQTELADGLILTKVSVPIGVLLVIFESRPDSLPQIASLALRSANGLMLKGGKEAERSNSVLHRIIVDTVYASTGGKVPRSVIGLVRTRAQVSSLLRLDNVIDLCIPRGSGELVKSIKEQTKIPVLGHAEGVCHMFVDCEIDSKGTGKGMDKGGDKDKHKVKDISISMAEVLKVVVDAKCDYPAACNALETLLLHEKLFEGEGEGDQNGGDIASTRGMVVVNGLIEAGVTVLYGPKIKAILNIGKGEGKGNNGGDSGDSGEGGENEVTFRQEFGDLRVAVEVVEGVVSAINHINTYGSGHTDVIVTENRDSAALFLKAVDAACVFHNASSRFSDGFRFGLGAEVGISTGRIHARGPVGVEGLLTTKYVLNQSPISKRDATTTASTDAAVAVATVSQFAASVPQTDRRVYTHKKMG